MELHVDQSSMSHGDLGGVTRSRERRGGGNPLRNVTMSFNERKLRMQASRNVRMAVMLYAGIGWW
jgi:hypothetical protein